MHAHTHTYMHTHTHTHTYMHTHACMHIRTHTYAYMYSHTYTYMHTEVALDKFFFVDIQSLCEIPEKEDEQFLPCELAAVEYSLHSGIHKSTHRFIDPGR